MNTLASQHPRLRFGVFEVDLHARELHKQGFKVRLQPQPFQILAMLLEHPQELVTREEIRERLWPSHTFVDFEHSVNAAVKKLREALGEEAETPRFIETLPRRGYRFIGEMEPVEIAGSTQTAEQRADELRRTNEVSVTTKGYPQRLPPRRLLWVMTAGAVVLLAAYGIRTYSTRVRSPAAPTAVRSLAVFPLEDLSHDPDVEHFSVGLTDTLTANLQQVATLRVISRTSATRYKGARMALPEIARELDVDAAVEGSVQRADGHMRITVQLLEARTDRHLWAETYDRDFDDVIQLEKAMALAIAHEVAGRLAVAQESSPAGSRRVSPDAYGAYLRGRFLWGERSAQAEIGARVNFEEALRDDPHFALANSGLADCYSTSWFSEPNLPLAEHYAQKAVALAPGLAEGHASLGAVALFRHQFATAEKELQRAIEFNPNYAVAHHWRALELVALARSAEALAESSRARQLEPFSLPINYLHGSILLGLREYDRAIEQLRLAAAIDPESPAPHQELLRIYWLERRIPEALEEERAVATLAYDPALVHDQEELAKAYRSGGQRAVLIEAVQLKEAGCRRNQREKTALTHGSYSPFAVALQYALVGDREKTLEWLEQAAQAPTNYFTQDLMTAPELDSLHSDPRFQDLVRRLGLMP